VPISGEQGQNNEQVGAPSKERFTKNVSDLTVLYTGWYGN